MSYYGASAAAQGSSAFNRNDYAGLLEDWDARYLTESGGNVSEVTGTVGGYHLTASGVTYTASDAGLNGFPSFTTSASGSYLRNLSIPRGADCTIYAVALSRTFSASTAWQLFDGPGATNGRMGFYGMFNSTDCAINTPTTHNSLITSLGDNLALVVSLQVSTSGSVAPRLAYSISGGAVAASSGLNFTPTRTAENGLIIGNNYLLNVAWRAAQTRVLVYNSAHDSTDQDDAVAKLAALYA